MDNQINHEILSNIVYLTRQLPPDTGDTGFRVARLRCILHRIADIADLVMIDDIDRRALAADADIALRVLESMAGEVKASKAEAHKALLALAKASE